MGKNCLYEDDVGKKMFAETYMFIKMFPEKKIFIALSRKIMVRPLIRKKTSTARSFDDTCALTSWNSVLYNSTDTRRESLPVCLISVPIFHRVYPKFKFWIVCLRRKEKTTSYLSAIKKTRHVWIETTTRNELTLLVKFLDFPSSKIFELHQ